MTSGSQEQDSSKESPTVLELQRIALHKALSTFDLDAAVQSCTSCQSNTCNPPPT
jgi:hypothetical protein